VFPNSSAILAVHAIEVPRLNVEMMCGGGGLLGGALRVVLDS
jgi:hypothetical protein